MLDNLKHKIGGLLLKQELKKQKRKVKAVNLEKAHSVAVLFCADDEKTTRMVNDYIRQLREEGIRKVEALGFVPYKEFPEFIGKNEKFRVFTKKELNWYHKPKSEEAERFQNENFDILIALNPQNSFPLKYILALSKAKFKVGRYSEKLKEYYDLMINVQEVNSLSYLISQMNHYLKMINKT